MMRGNEYPFLRMIFMLRVTESLGLVNASKPQKMIGDNTESALILAKVGIVGDDHFSSAYTIGIELYPIHMVQLAIVLMVLDLAGACDI